MVDNRINAIGKSAAFGFILLSYPLFFVPLTIYVGNIDEFSVSFLSIVKTYLPLAAVLICLFGLLAMLLPNAARQKFILLLAAIGLLFWLQGNILVWHYGLLDGRAIDWSENSWRGWLDISVWVGVLLAALTFDRKHLISKLAIIIFVLQLALAALNLFQHQQVLRSNNVDANAQTAKEAIYTFSKTTNVVQILADGFQSDIFEELINDGERGKKISDSLSGFTFFREHLGAFPFTHMSMPAILSGKLYKNHVPIDQHMEESIGGETSLSVAYDAGYEVDIVTPGGLLRTMYERSPSTNLYTVPPRQHLTDTGIETFESAKLLDLSLFRLVPHFAKQFVYNDQLWLVQSFMTDTDYMGLQFFRHMAFLKEMAESLTVAREKPVYKFIHLTLSHNPMVTDEQCNYAGQVLQTVRPTVKFQARCALEGMVKLIDAMKQQGVYDDALIVFMADHGAWVTPSGIKGPLADDQKSMEIINPQLAALAMPLLAIKRPGDTGPIQVSNAPSWVPDTPKTVTDLLGLANEFSGKNVFDLETASPRERKFYFYEYQRNEWGGEFLTPITEAVVNGPVQDRASWRVTETYLPNGVVERENPVALPTAKAVFQ